MATHTDIVAERLKRLDRLAALVYGVATQDLTMCPPWHELPNESKNAWRIQVREALRGTHPYLKYHKP